MKTSLPFFFDAQHCGDILAKNGYVYVILGSLCFSTTGTIQALAPEGTHPLTIGALRMEVGAAALWLWCACRGNLPHDLPSWPLRWLIPATLGLLGFQVFFFGGIQSSGVAVGTVTAIGVSPIMAAVLARVVLREKPDRLWYPATLLALIGLWLLNMQDGQTLRHLPVLPLLAGCCYACYFVFAKPLGRSHAPEHVMLLLCAGSGVLLLPVHLFLPPGWLLEPHGMGIALYLGVVTAALAFSLTLAGLRRTPTAIAATLALIEPLGAACWDVFFLGEQLNQNQTTGMLLLCAGVLLETLGKKAFQGEKRSEKDCPAPGTCHLAWNRGDVLHPRFSPVRKKPPDCPTLLQCSDPACCTRYAHAGLGT